MHFDSITHLRYLASLSSVATGLLRPCPVTRRAVPSTMSQEGQDLLTDEKRRPSEPRARTIGRRDRLEKTHAYVRTPSSNPTATGLPYWEGKGKLTATSLAGYINRGGGDRGSRAGFFCCATPRTRSLVVGRMRMRIPTSTGRRERPPGRPWRRTDKASEVHQFRSRKAPATGRFGDRGDTTKCAVARRGVGRNSLCPSARLGDGKKGWV